MGSYSIKIVDNAVRVIHLQTRFTSSMGFSVHIPHIEGVLFDSGYPHARGVLLEALRGLSVERVVNTHSHEDHLGNNFHLQRELGSRLYAPAASLSIAKKPPRIPLFRRAIWGTPDPCHPEALPEIIVTGKFQFRAIPTPGHIDDMVAFHEAERGWVIGGDLYLGDRIRVGATWENGKHWIASLERVLALKPRIFFCYHRGAILKPQEALGRKLDFLRTIERKARDMRAQGLSIHEISHRLLGREKYLLKLLSAGEFSKMNLIRSFL